MTTEPTDSFSFHRAILAEFVEKLPKALAEVVQEEQQQELMENLHQACNELDTDQANGWHLGQNWLFSFIGNHPQLTPVVPRDLLWFFGGDCLHFLTDEEISRFQQIEDRVAEEGSNWADVRRQVMNH
ncbi:PA2817 family protein [Parendozoicomonas sp. Alg238-R29]|uniref:PA2817 family protein n=1 Tax=Parendozoicomonas sp. Alg238-R29 TaxID=2993446 RepID=UPI00248EAEC1|nr:PA2817 family protein [Parendozoicomonas sp. Alg238-R29]